MEIIGVIGVATIIWYGGYLVIQELMTPGAFFSFMAAMFMAYTPIKKLSGANNLIQQALAAADPDPLYRESIRDGRASVVGHRLGLRRPHALQRMALGRRYRCFAVDNRGVGGTSGAPHPLSLEQMADDAIAVLDAEGVDSAHVQGASMGE